MILTTSLDFSDHTLVYSLFYQYFFLCWPYYYIKFTCVTFRSWYNILEFLKKLGNLFFHLYILWNYCQDLNQYILLYLNFQKIYVYFVHHIHQNTTTTNCNCDQICQQIIIFSIFVPIVNLRSSCQLRFLWLLKNITFINLGSWFTISCKIHSSWFHIIQNSFLPKCHRSSKKFTTIDDDLGPPKADIEYSTKYGT